MEFVTQVPTTDEIRTNRVLWVADLLGGEYEQGQGFLTKEDDAGIRHCCLGVLCKTAGLVGIPETECGDYDEDCEREFTVHVYDGYHGQPPELITNAVQLDPYQVSACICKNDDGGTFEEIVHDVLTEIFGDDVIVDAEKLVAERQLAG